MNRLLTPKIVLIFLLILNGSVSSFGQTSKKELLLGKWAFEKFDFSGEMDFVPVERRNADNEKNRGLVITFSPDNKFQSVQKGGLPENNVRGSYKLIGDTSLNMSGGVAKIATLDAISLRLHIKGRPDAVFKRVL